jgi:hypothetical protein
MAAISRECVSLEAGVSFFRSSSRVQQGPRFALWVRLTLGPSIFGLRRPGGTICGIPDTLCIQFMGRMISTLHVRNSVSLIRCSLVEGSVMRIGTWEGSLKGCAKQSRAWTTNSAFIAHAKQLLRLSLNHCRVSACRGNSSHAALSGLIL